MVNILVDNSFEYTCGRVPKFLLSVTTTWSHEQILVILLGHMMGLQENMFVSLFIEIQISVNFGRFWKIDFRIKIPK